MTEEVRKMRQENLDLWSRPMRWKPASHKQQELLFGVYAVYAGIEIVDDRSYMREHALPIWEFPHVQKEHLEEWDSYTSDDKAMVLQAIVSPYHKIMGEKWPVVGMLVGFRGLE